MSLERHRCDHCGEQVDFYMHGTTKPPERCAVCLKLGDRSLLWYLRVFRGATDEEKEELRRRFAAARGRSWMSSTPWGGLDDRRGSGMVLPAPTADDLKDEIENITAHLIEKFGMKASGLRRIVRAACRTMKAREPEPCSSMRLATADDLLSDLEIAAIQLNNSRMAMSAVGRGIKAVTA